MTQEKTYNRGCRTFTFREVPPCSPAQLGWRVQVHDEEGKRLLITTINPSLWWALAEAEEWVDWNFPA